MTHFLPGDSQKEALALRDTVASRITSEQMARAQELARQWQPRQGTATKVSTPAPAGLAASAAAVKREDYATAYRAWLPLAEQGLAEAQFWLGWLYYHGQGVPHNDVEAAQWYRRAAEQGHATAQFALGGMYAEGRGVPQDHIQAYMWFALAASRMPPPGRTVVVFGRDSIAALMPPLQLAKAKQLASQWQPKPETSSP